MSGGWRGGSERRGYYLKRRGRLVLGGTINEGVEGRGGSLSAFVNMCLCLDHLHREMLVSICRAAGQIQSQPFAHVLGSQVIPSKSPPIVPPLRL